MKFGKTLFVFTAVFVCAFVIGCTKPQTGVYLLNFKPEIDKTFGEVAAQFTKETGISMKVVTAASGTYEQSLRSELNKKAAPTLFSLNGPVGYNQWKDFTADLKDSNVYGWLLDKSTAITDDGGVYGIPWTIETYGIIYNDEILRRYFALKARANKELNSATEINNFAKLAAVSLDIQAHKSDLKIEGAFASTSFTPGEDWRWNTHLANLPIFYEYKDKGVSDENEVTFSFADNFKNIFDLYINNSITDRKLVGSMTVGDSMSEFAMGKVAFVQNGTWGWSQISNESGNVVKREDVKFLPIYTGAPGEESQGLCTGTENFIAINKKVSAESQAASMQFLEWLFNTPQGRENAYKKLGFVAPFSTFSAEEIPDDPLVAEMFRYMNDSSKYSVSWVFQTFPSQEFKNIFGASLLDYTVGNKQWDDVKNTFISTWASEKNAVQYTH
ncbi:MAG: ABC transporter substrate-binding protein [Termitinemataceae bacterium]|nr:MAG: ABC transporter substrate-binding protein [Termitinemataceae bacterium]